MVSEPDIDEVLDPVNGNDIDHVAPSHVARPGSPCGRITHPSTGVYDGVAEGAEDGAEEGVVLHAVAAHVAADDLAEEVIWGEGEEVGLGVMEGEVLEWDAGELAGLELLEVGERARGGGEVGVPVDVLEVARYLVWGVCSHGRLVKILGALCQRG